MYLSFNAEAGCFHPAEDPNLEVIEAIASFIRENPGKNQREIFDWVKDALRIGRKTSLTTLLRRGERAGRWRTERGLRGAKLYVSF
jgi:hypothetical protein